MLRPPTASRTEQLLELSFVHRLLTEGVLAVELRLALNRSFAELVSRHTGVDHSLGFGSSPGEGDGCLFDARFQTRDHLVLLHAIAAVYEDRTNDAARGAAEFDEGVGLDDAIEELLLLGRGNARTRGDPAQGCCE